MAGRDAPGWDVTVSGTPGCAVTGSGTPDRDVLGCSAANRGAPVRAWRGWTTTGCPETAAEGAVSSGPAKSAVLTGADSTGGRVSAGGGARSGPATAVSAGESLTAGASAY